VAAKILLASSNVGKLREFQGLAKDSSFALELELLGAFDSIPEFEESAPTFAENSLGKALYYSQHTNEAVIADDSGLVVPSLGGRPGVHSARYAGVGATSEQQIEKLLDEMDGMSGAARTAYFVCALSLVRRNRPLAVITAQADGEILTSSLGTGGFGYDPIFFFPTLQKSFRRLLAVLPGVL
jgi:XTP/dITP diphosphohydrolase